MKKILMSTLLLAGVVGGMATTAHADDTATAKTWVEGWTVSGGITIETVDSIDFGDIAIGGSSEKDQVVTVINRTGSDIDITVKLDENFNDGVTLASRTSEGMSSNIGADPADLTNFSTIDPSWQDWQTQENQDNPNRRRRPSFPIDWVLEASSSAQLDSDLNRTLIYTASPVIDDGEGQ